jgi:hypothetical protein
MISLRLNHPLPDKHRCLYPLLVLALVAVAVAVRVLVLAKFMQKHHRQPRTKMARKAQQ